MKIIIVTYLFMSLMLASCGGSDSGGGAIVPSTESGPETPELSVTENISALKYYMAAFENNDVDFKSKTVSGYAFSDEDPNEIVVIRGDVNEYRTFKDGTERPGVHLPDIFRYRYAIYKMNRSNGKAIYTFDRGSCGSINPFSETFLQEGVALSLKIENKVLDLEFTENQIVKLPEAEGFGENVIGAAESEADFCASFQGGSI